MNLYQHGICNLIGWEDFGLYLRNKIFPKYRICSGTQQMIKIFIIEQIQWKLMTKFFFKLKNSCFWSISQFFLPWPDWRHPFLIMPTQKFFSQFLIYVNRYQHAKKAGYFTNLFWRYSWLKNPATWLAENILAHISETKIFPNMGIVQKHSK